MITIKNLDFSYKKNFKIIDNLSFEVPTNSIFGFLGSNGSGKTTTIRLLLNLCKPNGGEILINNQKITRNSIKAFQDIGTLIEQPTLYKHLTGKENLAIFCNYYNVKKSRIDEVLELVDLADAKTKKVKQYSMGMKQRLGIATSLLHNPSLLILDEPLNGLDPKGISEIRNLIFRLKDEGKTIFVSSHLLSEIEKTCDNVCIIDKGKKLFSGQITELKDILVKTEQFKVHCDKPKEAGEIITTVFQLDNDIEEGIIGINIKDKTIVPQIIEKLVHSNIQLYEFYQKDNSLEDLFLKLTN